ncbi:Beta-glucuronidase [Zalerion maritima]|uniref:Beta-glucuronidase n=1 Tax=Zalerion maritima TaxID=339359 RepID=A0AAD5WNH1_9PEZI|nr:Beta-glucuronidase [Zalerion maritima]
MCNFKLASLSGLALVANLVSAVTYSVPSEVGTGGLEYYPLDAAPLSLSFEFFAFPSYMTNVTATMRCLENWKDLTGVWPHIRSGGTTQDRALFDPDTDAYVVYYVADPADAPASLTFGPNYMELASEYPGEVTIGLNRGKNQIDNTIAAAQSAVDQMGNLYAIELGNEPEYYSGVQPIASGTWNPSVDSAIQNNWDIIVGEALGMTNIIQAGNSLPSSWSSTQLIESGNETVYQYVKEYSRHNYPGGSVSSLMSHANIASNIHSFDEDVASANGIGKPLFLGETNSVSGGGATDVSPLFGAALWTMDYTVRAAASNITRTYFHQGTIGAAPYNMWGRYSGGNPYVGAYAAVAFMAEGSYVAALDSGSDNYAVYATYGSDGKPLRVLLYNSDYYTSGTRPTESFTLTGLDVSSLQAKRLTAPTASSRQDRGEPATYGGQGFDDGTCVIDGDETWELVTVSGGSATVSVGASEAVVVHF